MIIIFCTKSDVLVLSCKNSHFLKEECTFSDCIIKGFSLWKKSISLFKNCTNILKEELYFPKRRSVFPDLISELF